MTGIKPNRMLAILAHPDDECFAVGGTLAKYAHQGIQVVLLTATRGEGGLPGSEPEKAGAIPEQELLRAAAYLGIQVYFLDYQDGELSTADPWKLLEHIACWIDTVQPQVILTFGPDGISGHPDHVAISRTVTQAVQQFFPNICLLYIAPSEATAMGRGVPSFSANPEKPRITVDISDYKLEKVRAIHCHASQHPPQEEKTEEDVRDVPGSEYFTVAHSVKQSNDLAGCFNGEENPVPHPI